MSDEVSPTRVQGIVFDTSRGTLIFFAICLGLLGFASSFVLWDTWNHQDGEYLLPFHLAKDSLFTSFTVGLGSFGGIAGFIGLLFNSLFPQQVILGDEVLQVISTNGFRSKVATQVPYTNIATVACEREEYGFKQLQVGIDVIHPDAAGMFPILRDFGKKEPGERDLYLPGFLTASPEEIAKLLSERCKKNDDAGSD